MDNLMETMLARTPEPLRAGFAHMNAMRDEHAQLQYFEGTWKHSMKLMLGADSSAGEGTTVAEPIHGGRHYLLTDEGTLEGTSYTSSSTLGFDNVRGEYVTTTMDSLRTGVFVAYGDFDPDANVYTFYGQVPDLKSPGGIGRVRLVRRIVDNDHFVFEWYEVRGGKEVQTMESEFTRQ